MITLNEDGVVIIKCDDCGKTDTFDPDEEEAIWEARRLGWDIYVTVGGNEKSFCPDCAADSIPF